MRSAIITEAVFCSFLISLRWFPWGTPISSTNKKLQRSNSKLVTSCGGRLLAHLLLLLNRAGVAGSRSVLTRHRLKYKALVQIRHLFIYLLIIYNNGIIEINNTYLYFHINIVYILIYNDYSTVDMYRAVIPSKRCKSSLMSQK